MHNAQELGVRLSRAFRDFDTFALAEAERPAGLDEAEKIQDAMIAGLGSDLTWKLGATQAAGLAAMGLPRFFFGALPAERVVRGGGVVAGPWREEIGVECEYAFRFERDLKPGAQVDIDMVKAAIGGVHAAFEIPATRYSVGLSGYGGLGNVADDGLAGWLVVGEEIARDQFESLSNNVVRLLADGKVMGEGVAAKRIDRFPYDLLTDFVRLGTPAATPSGRGNVVPGSCTGYVKVPLGAAIQGDFGGLGKVEAVFQSFEALK